MSQKPKSQEAAGPPSWFDDVDLDNVASQLNPLLRATLKEQLPGDLGSEIAAGMEIWQLDSYRQGRQAPTGEKLDEITTALNQALWKILIEEYDVPKEEAEKTIVRRWGLLAGASNPRCRWHACWDNTEESLCWWKECCPCV